MSFEDTLDMLVRRHDELRDMLARGDQLASQDFVKYSKGIFGSDAVGGDNQRIYHREENAR